MDRHVDGLRIVDFFKGKELFITGATGFLGKVLVEKILREIPEVSKIYLLIRARNAEIAMQRVKNEIINTELFKLLQEMYGDFYDEFMMSKLVPVAGNMRNSDIVMQQNLASLISTKLDVIINSAANITWDERYDVSIDTNVKGPCNLLAFAKRCKQLKLFLHISTVYVNGERVGKIMEKACCLGDVNIKGETLDVGHEFQLAFSQNSSTRQMKELGLIRAKKFGWYNTYEFTKAMGEMMIDHTREDIPVVIIRPSSIESAMNDPFPGWIQGINASIPIIKMYGEGKLPCFLADPSWTTDLIPVDMLTNVILAAIAKHGSIVGEEDIKVYHVASCTTNPLLLRDFFRILYEHFTSFPQIHNGITIKVSPSKFFDSFQGFSDGLRSNKILQINQIEHMAKLYKSYGFYRGRYDTNNMEKLMEEMSAEEKKKFNINVQSINWEHYMKNIHIPSVKRRFMKKVKIESML